MHPSFPYLLRPVCLSSYPCPCLYLLHSRIPLQMSCLYLLSMSFSRMPCLHPFCPASIPLFLSLTLMPSLHPSCHVFFSNALPQSLLLCSYLLSPVCIPLVLPFSLMPCLHPSFPVLISYALSASLLLFLFL